MEHPILDDKNRFVNNIHRNKKGRRTTKTGCPAIDKQRLYRDRIGLYYNILKLLIIKSHVPHIMIRDYCYSSGVGLRESMFELVDCGAIESFDYTMPKEKYKNGRVPYTKTHYRITAKGKKLLRLIYEQGKMLPPSFTRYNVSSLQQEDDDVMLHLL